MSAPLLGQFLVAINGFIKANNAAQITDYLALEPPFNPQYNGMIQELRQQFPRGNEQQLEARCQQSLPAATAQHWTNFIRFMAHYLAYLRDISSDQNKYLESFEHLLELQAKANSALSQSSSGILMLQTVITNARLLCRLAIGLDRKPELISQLQNAGMRNDGSGGARETLPERAANTVRTAFVTCLNDRTEAVGVGQIKGKQPGIYVLANLCLKILFQCRKTRNATQIFENISNSAPPLAQYPKSQQVTYLYYLGRFLFQNSHFYRAQLVLQHAYDTSPHDQQCTKQRRLILIYLIAANMTMGRFPLQALLSRPEARDFGELFLPICHAIRQGNIQAFHRCLDPDGSNGVWFMQHRILFQLRNRCKVLVWRSLMRKTFQLFGSRPAAETRMAATLDLSELVTAFSTQQSSDDFYVDPDLLGVEDELSTHYQHDEIPAIISKLSSLIDQGLVSGYISREREKLAILGAKQTGGDSVKAGFPQVWSVISKKFGDTVPGWKQEVQRANPFAGAGPGSVVRLSGVRAVGVN